MEQGGVRMAFAVFSEMPRGEYTKVCEARSMLHAGLENGYRLKGIFNKYGIGFTLFPVGSWLEYAASEVSGSRLRTLYGDQHIGNHTYSHSILKRVAGREPQSQIAAEAEEGINKANRLIVEIFGVRPEGFAAPCGFEGGFDENQDGSLLDAVKRCGFSWCISDMRGQHDSLFAPLSAGGIARQPHRYANGMIEIPTHGWQDAAFKHVHSTERPENAPMTDDEIAESYAAIRREAAELAKRDERMIDVVCHAHLDFMHGPSTKSGGYTDKSLSVWERLVREGLEDDVQMVMISEIYSSASLNRATPDLALLHAVEALLALLYV